MTSDKLGSQGQSYNILDQLKIFMPKPFEGNDSENEPKLYTTIKTNKNKILICKYCYNTGHGYQDCNIDIQNSPLGNIINTFKTNMPKRQKKFAKVPESGKASESGKESNDRDDYEKQQDDDDQKDINIRANITELMNTIHGLQRELKKYEKKLLAIGMVAMQWLDFLVTEMHLF